MRKRLPHLLDVPGFGRLSVLLFLVVCFGVGALTGCFFAGLLSFDTQTHLIDYLSGCFAIFKENGAAVPSMSATIWELCRWPMLLFLLGLTSLGAVGIPAVFCIRGFLLSYSVSVFVRLFGGGGLLTALTVFGVSIFFVLPVCFILGISGFGSARALAGAWFGEGRSVMPFLRGYFVRTGACCLLLAFSVFLQSCITPVLLRAAVGLIS